MATKDEVLKRFDTILGEGAEILRSGGWNGRRWKTQPPLGDYVRWRVRALNLLRRVCGEDSDHYKQLLHICSDDKTKTKSFFFGVCFGIVEAAKDDFDDEFLLDLRQLLSAEIFADFLGQAEELLQKGYHVAAASLTGAVLEDSLRKLCDRNSLTLPPKAGMEMLNVELAKAGVYTTYVQKEIRAKTDIRNRADHGCFDEVERNDVANMIRWVKRFARKYVK